MWKSSRKWKVRSHYSIVVLELYFDTGVSNSFIVVRMMNELGLVPQDVIPVISAYIINITFPIMTWLDLDSLGQNSQPRD